MKPSHNQTGEQSARPENGTPVAVSPTSPASSSPWPRYTLILFGGVLGVLSVWSYWPTLLTLYDRWSTDPQYSHGYLVPVFALAYLWIRRGMIKVEPLQPSWLGLGLLLIALTLRLAGTYFYFDWFDRISILPAVAGIFLLVGGWAALRWSWPAIGFLIFMMPMPYRVEIALAHPLQRIATVASTYVMQAVGLPAVAEGNVILLDEVKIGVVEACSGLRMLVVFFALSTAFVLLGNRLLWERVVLVLSAVPIAILSNLIRITVTGIMHGTGHSEMAEAFFHDVAGWLMMPLALGFLWVEVQILSRLLIDQGAASPVPVHLANERAKNRPDQSRPLHPVKSVGE